MAEALVSVARVAREESLYRNIRVLEVPARQLFHYNARGDLAAHPDARSNRLVPVLSWHPRRASACVRA